MDVFNTTAGMKEALFVHWAPGLSWSSFDRFSFLSSFLFLNKKLSGV